ncbi:hypothetical protein PR048_017548 [Dryococelus australis]|uniref:Uncharacterized protein n=1 Tax=Dryococelus australis TaxID=614101 RepID=A0ABQ9H9W4_9NEOP|nr:hypothetical protein PR048_017548 [Dryococelus australis]
MLERGKRDIPEKTHQPVASSGTIPACENSAATPPGIEPGSPWPSPPWLRSVTAVPRQAIHLSSAMSRRRKCCALRRAAAPQWDASLARHFRQRVMTGSLVCWWLEHTSGAAQHVDTSTGGGGGGLGRPSHTLGRRSRLAANHQLPASPCGFHTGRAGSWVDECLLKDSGDLGRDCPALEDVPQGVPPRISVSKGVTWPSATPAVTHSRLRVAARLCSSRSSRRLSTALLPI